MTESISSEEHRQDQSAQVGRNLIQVGRDYVRYIVFQFDSGNWGVAAANLGVLLLIVGGLVNGLLGGASYARSLISPPQPTEPTRGGMCCLPASSQFEKLDVRMARLERSLTQVVRSNRALQTALKARSAPKPVTKPESPQTVSVSSPAPVARVPRRPRTGIIRMPRRPLPRRPRPRFPDRPIPERPIPSQPDPIPNPDSDRPQTQDPNPGSTIPGNNDPTPSPN